ncbi:MAG: DUF2339 domain-containing protein [Geothrix sp.]|uniref:DUF2339 domain-containing protein n=1 Tax=Geothrix sp. TaxID=1962974 RepID=UPI0017EE4ADB|nr:DUF2339 domain-containing protein [Geothrix sp.]NWJ40895.1 DUF2339 domain-containing protein [Geothrix sp.]WIL21105.1 MAG: DUF2339 domain-containing protein [Geothrix sp.]
MEPQAPQDPAAQPELAERVARLEAQVAWLLQRQQAPPTQAPVPQAAPATRPLPRPVVRPAVPRKEISPVVWIAGIAASIFLLGTIFFFRWAIQQGWVGAELRFVLGLLVGGAIAAFAAKLILGDSHRLGVALLLAGLGTLQFTFRAGAMEYHFYAAPLGLAATALVTLLAGGLAARGRSGGALTVALVSGLVAPLVFSQGGHHEVALAVYLAVLMAAALAVPYLARTGGSWHGARWTALVGVWLLLLPACLDVMKGDAATLALLLVLHLVLAGLWAWLPGTEERPGTPTVLWLVASILATSYGWLVWKRMDLAVETFALPVLLVAALNLALVQPLRHRMGGRCADWGLLALIAGHLALAVPVALAWAWVGPLWGAFALGLAWASLKAEKGDFAEEATALRWLAAALALATTLRWAFHGLDGLLFSSHGYTPLLNPAFAEGALASAAWWLLTRRGGPLGLISFMALQVTANVTLAFEAARLVQRLQAPARPGLGYGPSRAASIAMTLVWALSGAWQWMRGLGQRDEARRALMIAGYAWMGIASFKLIAADLDHADTPLRALAFLGVGAIGMAAAILANRSRSGEAS